MVLASKPATPPILERHDATWQDYLTIGNHPTLDWQKISFYQGWLWVNMGKEGPEHASVSDFITIIFGFWAFLHPDVPLQSYSRCLIEYPETHACAPDLVLYKGENIPGTKLASRGGLICVSKDPLTWWARLPTLPLLSTWTSRSSFMPVWAFLSTGSLTSRGGVFLPLPWPRMGAIGPLPSHRCWQACR